MCLGRNDVIRHATFASLPGEERMVFTFYTKHSLTTLMTKLDIVKGVVRASSRTPASLAPRDSVRDARMSGPDRAALGGGCRCGVWQAVLSVSAPLGTWYCSRFGKDRV